MLHILLVPTLIVEMGKEEIAGALDPSLLFLELLSKVTS